MECQLSPGGASSPGSSRKQENSTDYARTREADTRTRSEIKPDASLDLEYGLGWRNGRSP